jgi:hypothetical protein
MRPKSSLVVLLSLGFSSGLAIADEPQDRFRRITFPGESTQFLSRLKLADELAGKKKWSEAIDEYQRLIHEAGDSLVPAESPKEAPSAIQRSVRLRLLCHARIAALPADGLKVYRRRVDLQAKRWLQEGIADRNVAALRRVIDEAFCSSAGDKALDLLGDLAFERGEFVEAQRWWHMLTSWDATLGGEEQTLRRGELRFPEPQIDLTLIRAKQILSLIFQGDLAQARSALKDFAVAYPKSQGHLAGRDGNLKSILQELLRKPPPFPENDQWPTFAGSFTRNRVLPAALPRRLWVEGPTWRVRLDTGGLLPPDSLAAQGPAPSPEVARRLSCHPVIVENKVVLADARRVQAFDLESGRLLFRHELPGGTKGPANTYVAEPGERYTLTAAEGRLYCVHNALPAGK